MKDVLRRGWVAPLTEMARLMGGYYRTAFLGSALRAGVLQHLGRGPATAEELAAGLGYDPSMVDGLRAWLDLGVGLGDLGRRGDAYAVRSRRARALLKPANDPIAAFYEELVELEHRLILETPGRLARGERFVLTDAEPGLIARTSRMGEPWLADAIAAVVPREGTPRLVEVGCGSGAHMRTAAEVNPGLTGLGLELQEPAAQQARANLAAWGLTDRFSVETGDVRDRPGTGDADLVTLHQNIYYFPEDRQVDLLRHLSTFLRPGGTLLVTTIVRDGGIGSAGLDVWGGMTEGTSRLPVPDELVARLRQAGYADATARRIGPGRMYAAFTGTRPR